MTHSPKHPQDDDCCAPKASDRSKRRASTANHSDGHAAATHDGDGTAWAHFVGTAIGVAAGMLVLAGHILNIRATRSCCEDDA